MDMRSFPGNVVYLACGRKHFILSGRNAREVQVWIKPRAALNQQVYWQGHIKCNCREGLPDKSEISFILGFRLESRQFLPRPLMKSLCKQGHYTVCNGGLDWAIGIPIDSILFWCLGQAVNSHLPSGCPQVPWVLRLSFYKPHRTLVVLLTSSVFSLMIIT